MARRDSHAKQLRALAPFSSLKGRDVERIAEAGTYVHQPADWSLMSEGTGADKAYIILSGTASVRHQGREIATMGAGDMVGALGVLGRKLRSASVVSSSEMEVLHFTRERLQELVEQIPPFGQALQRIAEERLG